MNIAAETDVSIDLPEEYPHAWISRGRMYFGNWCEDHPEEANILLETITSTGDVAAQNGGVGILLKNIFSRINGRSQKLSDRIEVMEWLVANQNSLTGNKPAFPVASAHNEQNIPRINIPSELYSLTHELTKVTDTQAALNYLESLRSSDLANANSSELTSILLAKWISSKKSFTDDRARQYVKGFTSFIRLALVQNLEEEKRVLRSGLHSIHVVKNLTSFAYICQLFDLSAEQRLVEVQALRRERLFQRMGVGSEQ